VEVIFFYFGTGGISPTFNFLAATSFTGDKFFPCFHASKYFQGKVSPRLTHHVSGFDGVGHEIPK
jgi:hypothetical protein